MTPVSALEYVRSRRPRVLLAPSQWKAVQEYKQWRMVSASQTGSGDAVLITKADLEGYRSPSKGKEVAIVPRVMGRSSPMIAKLSCLFSTLKVSSVAGPVSLKLTETPAC